MKKLLLILFALSFVLFSAYPVLAQISTPGAGIRSEKLASRAAVLKAKLQQFKDQQKAARVERINTELARINNKRAEQMLKFLDRASNILSRLETRVDEATAAGKDTGAAKQAIADAKTALDSAKTAVEAQAQNDYTISITSESTVRADARAARDKLRIDLQTLKSQITAAKQAVGKAIKVAATTLGE